jgi:hypothetical protein
MQSVEIVQQTITTKNIVITGKGVRREKVGSQSTKTYFADVVPYEDAHKQGVTVGYLKVYAGFSDSALNSVQGILPQLQMEGVFQFDLIPGTSTKRTRVDGPVTLNILKKVEWSRNQGV